jgi:hypothetical protein
MNTKVWLFVSFAVLSLGCEDDKKKQQELVAKTGGSSSAATASATPSATAAPSASAPAKPASLAERLKCDKLMPEKSLPGPLSNLKIGQPPATCADCGPTCSLVNAANPLEGASVNFVCNEKYDKANADKKLDELKKSLKKSQPITDVGRGGIGGEKDNGLFYEVVVFDDDSDCVVTVDWMRGKRGDAIAAAKFAIAGVKQSDL